jgi:plasmid stabilization system protein ParE
MAKKLIWDKEVLDQIDQVAEYIAQIWGKQSAKRFVENVRKTAFSLTKLPNVGRPSAKFEDVHFINIGQYHWLYYCIQATKIQIIYLFDTRQDPDKNPFG